MVQTVFYINFFWSGSQRFFDPGGEKIRESPFPCFAVFPPLWICPPPVHFHVKKEKTKPGERKTEREGEMEKKKPNFSAPIMTRKELRFTWYKASLKIIIRFLSGYCCMFWNALCSHSVGTVYAFCARLGPIYAMGWKLLWQFDPFNLWLGLSRKNQEGVSGIVRVGDILYGYKDFV